MFYSDIPTNEDNILETDRLNLPKKTDMSILRYEAIINDDGTIKGVDRQHNPKAETVKGEIGSQISFPK